MYVPNRRLPVMKSDHADPDTLRSDFTAEADPKSVVRHIEGELLELLEVLLLA